MQQASEEAPFLRRAVLHHEHRILNRHQTVVRAVDQQKSAARLVDDAQFDEGEVFLRVVQELFLRRVPEFLA